MLDRGTYENTPYTRLSYVAGSLQSDQLDLADASIGREWKYNRLVLKEPIATSLIDLNENVTAIGETNAREVAEQLTFQYQSAAVLFLTKEILNNGERALLLLV